MSDARTISHLQTVLKDVSNELEKLKAPPHIVQRVVRLQISDFTIITNVPTKRDQYLTERMDVLKGAFLGKDSQCYVRVGRWLNTLDQIIKDIINRYNRPDVVLYVELLYPEDHPSPHSCLYLLDDDGEFYFCSGEISDNLVPYIYEIGA